jgi:membrane-associated protease RseP (regulator of RpoE activity)
MSILFILLALAGFAFVIGIHEFGHFLFAKWAGVRVEVFSIGFGPRLITRKIGETEYSLSLLPLGGYVKMTGQEDLPENSDAPVTDPRSYLTAHPAWRAAILLGGVLFNFLSSYLLLIGLAVYGLPIISPVVGEVRPQIATLGEQVVASPAARLGVRPGDRIVAVNGVVVRGFEDAVTEVLMHPTSPIALTVERPGSGRLVLTGDGDVRPVYDPAAGLHTIGIEAAHGTRIADVADGGSDGPRAGERVVALDGVDLPAGQSGQDLSMLLQPKLGQEVALTLADAAGVRRTITVRWAGPGAEDVALGLPVMISGFSATSRAQAAGVQAGDIVVACGGVPVAGASHLQGLVRSAVQHSDTVALQVLRAGRPVDLVVPAVEVAGRVRLGVDLRSLAVGILPVLPPALDGGPGPLARAGVKPGEAIVAWSDRPAANGQPAGRGLTMVGPGERVVLPISAAGRRAGLKAERPGKLAAALGSKPVASIYERLIGSRVVATSDSQGRPVGSPVPGSIVLAAADGAPVTVELAPLGVDGVALLQALRPGDWITGDTVDSDGSPALEVLRGAAAPTRAVFVERQPVGVALAWDMETSRWDLQSPGEAFAIANRAAHTMIWKSLTFIPRFFRQAEQGGIDANKQLQGPIGIFSALKTSAERFGFDSFLKLVAFIGLNLVLVNLLPIPITDGGQLVFLAIETAIKRPLPAVVRNVAAWIGLILVVGLMLYVTSLDILRRV